MTIPGFHEVWGFDFEGVLWRAASLCLWISPRPPDRIRHFCHNMAMVAESDRWFVGSIPMMYEAYLVPLIFEPYAFSVVRYVV